MGVLCPDSPLRALDGNILDKEPNPVDGTEAEAAGDMRCLECGASIPKDSKSCPECGNEKLILPPRWSPPVRENASGGIFIMRDETRLIIGLTVALLISLWMLGSARAGNDERINNESETPVQVISADADVSADLPEPVISEIDVTAETESEQVNINEIRQLARLKEQEGIWPEAVLKWMEVTGCPDAQPGDYIALANAQKMADRLTASRETLNRTCARFPDSPDAYIAYGKLCEELGDLEAARIQYQIGLNHCQDNDDLHQLLNAVEIALNISDPPVEEPVLVAEHIPPPVEAPELPTEDLERADEILTSIEEASVVTSSDPTVADSSGAEQPVDLIGSGRSEDSGSVDTDTAPEPEENSLVSITDLRVDAVQNQVTIEIVGNTQMAFGSSSASDPPRLIIRIHNSQLSEGAGIPSSVSINTFLVERVNVVESSTDNSDVVMLVVYLGTQTRQSVSSGTNSVRIVITEATENQDGGESVNGNE